MFVTQNSILDLRILFWDEKEEGNGEKRDFNKKFQLTENECLTNIFLTNPILKSHARVLGCLISVNYCITLLSVSHSIPEGA